ncbi:uncharacterized protein LOC115447908 isoform X2 [Manduca sexta]|uniref:Uncharacterized protein n=1 Tax=Manduca sexta TaxID=7130 RepID=A0A922CSR5_MANSE|nr:uncharacterized protein LOC115447908 isoform X2 [Manduca sexta]KAG6457024.1 hypothetical protein O3G_MSEX010066 [Manduca sexta]
MFRPLTRPRLHSPLTNENRQVTATASALREIWSGGCRLSCRRSECSGLSGLVGTAAPGTSGAATTHDCICEFCPCALIDSVLRNCVPATAAYNTTVETLSEFYYSILKTFAEMYMLVQSALECGVSCQRPAQLLNLSRLDSNENFNFDGTVLKEKVVEKEIENLKGKDKTIDKIRKKLSALSKTDLNLSKLGIDKIKSSLSVKSAKESKTDVGKEEKEIKFAKQKSGNVSAHSSKDSTLGAPSPSTSSGHCPRCVEKGRVCIGTCPKANVESKK